jgi:hypothetical protein
VVIGTTVNAIVFIAYGIGNSAGPFMWKKAYQPRFATHIITLKLPIFSNAPRNRVPFIINAVVFAVCAITLLLIRTYLVWENKRRDEEFTDKNDYYDDVYLTHVDEKGNPVHQKVDRVRVFVSFFFFIVLRTDHIVYF